MLSPALREILSKALSLRTSGTSEAYISLEKSSTASLPSTEPELVTLTLNSSRSSGPKVLREQRKSEYSKLV